MFCINWLNYADIGIHFLYVLLAFRFYIFWLIICVAELSSY